MAEPPTVARTLTSRDGLPDEYVFSVLAHSSGAVWAGTLNGLSKIDPAVHSYHTRNGLSEPFVQALAEDSEGNVWVGTDGGGAVKIAHNGFTSFTTEDGLGAARVSSVFESRQGELLVVTRSGDSLYVNRQQGERFRAVQLNLPKRATTTSWQGIYRPLLEDRHGGWWVTSENGLFRFSGIRRLEDLATSPPSAHFDLHKGLPIDQLIMLHEDRPGGIWLAAQYGNWNPLLRFDPRAQSFDPVLEAAPFLKRERVNSFAEDAAGNLWMGLYHRGGLLRRRGGRFEFIGPAQGAPQGRTGGLHLDSLDRLWIASGEGGLARIDRPDEDRPVFKHYTTREGLSSNMTLSVTSDRFGRIYAGTGRGVDRLDPGTGRVKKFTTGDGLLLGEHNVAFRDRHGAIWFGANLGLSRLIPEPDRVRQPPPVRLVGLRIEDKTYPVAAAGETKLRIPDLLHDRNGLWIEYAGLSHAPGETIRYRFQLEGAGGDWSPATEQRSVGYANLPPGTYLFKVKAIDSDGHLSAEPAEFGFTILAPFWLRWWFVLATAAAVLSAAYALHRYRLNRLLELAHIRTQIAADLHDDIGSGLSHIAILSEVAQREKTPGNDSLARIAEVSRELTDSMSDIVWSISPGKDRVEALTQRMRRVAANLLGAANIEFQIEVENIDDRRGLPAETRRQIYLIFKEAVNNIIRHSAATQVKIGLAAVGSELILRIADNGRGLGSADSEEGNGLSTMRSRAAVLKAGIEWTAAGPGTAVTLRMPLPK